MRREPGSEERRQALIGVFAPIVGSVMMIATLTFAVRLFAPETEYRRPKIQTLSSSFAQELPEPGLASRASLRARRAGALRGAAPPVALPPVADVQEEDAGHAESEASTDGDSGATERRREEDRQKREDWLAEQERLKEEQEVDEESVGEGAVEEAPRISLAQRLHMKRAARQQAAAQQQARESSESGYGGADDQ